MVNVSTEEVLAQKFEKEEAAKNVKKKKVLAMIILL